MKSVRLNVRLPGVSLRTQLTSPRPAFHAYHGVKGDEHQAHLDEWSVQGYRMISLSLYGDPDSPLYAAVWVQRFGPAWEAVHGVDGAGYEAFLDLWIGKGYVPILISATGSFGHTVFAGVLERGITGAWLLAVVATQSMALLSALLARHFEQPVRLHINFVALSMWLWGGMMYIWMISLIFYRYTFFKFSPADFSSPYWINMGAMAISTLAGSLLIENSVDAPFLETLLPFLKGFTIFFWATGTWWIPMLVILVVWRHLYSKFPVRYDPLYWGAVFPLGMYAVCTFEMVRAMSLDFLLPIAHVFVYVALLAWAATFFGLINSLVSSLIPALHSANGRRDFR